MRFISTSLLLLALRCGSLTAATPAVASQVTGWFQVEQANDRWWFITPQGQRFIALGVNHLNELKGASVFGSTIFARRYGQDWPRVFAGVAEQCRGWGFNCTGFHPPEEMRDLLPYVISTKFIAASFYDEKLVYVDVFTPAFAQEAETKARAAAAEMNANPNAMAWAWNDSMCWDLRLTRKSFGTDWVSWIRVLPADAPGRKRNAEFLRERHGGDLAKLNAAYGTTFASLEELAWADWSRLDRDRPQVFADDREFLRLLARQYFQTLAAAFRRERPTGVLMGDRFHLREHPDEVLGIQPGDHFQPSLVKLTRPDETCFDTAEFDRLHKLTGKPIVIADYQCGFFDDQTPKTGGWYQYATAAEAADAYDRFLRDAFARPYIIGYFRCQFISVWKDNLKRYKQGLLRPDGTPFEDYLPRLTQMNHELLKTLLLN